ncbi:hypothetical protein [Sulfurimonas sp.]|uniref:hypothetical protein n=1 Tax=Sulfurimonas sp. TaxID=2022749 RepID=UPI00263820D1|nr:hypothetical protein [Sulfurimonas sp.]
MYKQILTSSFIAATILFSGCGNDDTTCRIGVQQAIDEGRYDDAITDLEGKCSTAFTTSDLNMNLAAAYMGKSGYSVSSIADMLINADDNGDAFSSFISSVDEKKNVDSLPLLTKANDFFFYAIEQNSTSDINTLCSADNIANLDDSRLTNACLYIGFNKTITAANTITYLTGDIGAVVDSISNDSNTTPYDMQASLDALQWATTSTYIPKSDTNITAKDINISSNPFTHIEVVYTENGTSSTFYRLAKSSVRDANNTTLITDGYCDSDGNRTACAGIENDDGSINDLTVACYACPVTLDLNATLSVADLLVDTLNGGSDTIAAVSGDEDITSSIADFKEEITGSRDGNITIDDIIDYLQQ